jgi:hypothetical protein
MVEEYFSTLRKSIDSYLGEVLVDILVCASQELEVAQQGKLDYCLDTIKDLARKYNFSSNVTPDLVTIAQYRRDFNNNYCNLVDILVWGESDMLVPQQAFTVLDYLHQSVPDTPKYITTFAICKMWDKSWEPLEHPEFTDKPFIEGDSENWWNIPYTMTEQEMNKFNNIEDLQVTSITPHKFNGCGLAISSEIIKAGVNIPSSVFFIHEDTAFMHVLSRLLPAIPQYHFKNLLVVHNRKHPSKRNYIAGEQVFEAKDIDSKRKSHNWYKLANEYCRSNSNNLFNPNYKSYTWKDVFKNA